MRQIIFNIFEHITERTLRNANSATFCYIVAFIFNPCNALT